MSRRRTRRRRRRRRRQRGGGIIDNLINKFSGWSGWWKQKTTSGNKASNGAGNNGAGNKGAGNRGTGNRGTGNPAGNKTSNAANHATVTLGGRRRRRRSSHNLSSAITHYRLIVVDFFHPGLGPGVRRFTEC